ncbi:guanylate kinase [Bacillus sp. FJAT-28004]|uniref:guanylate kinase n=1 Tax=Bacillus sp. FJAT-28004 TaxID=1679165 RepID=UPI0006B60C9F|nr:guanylate kinase [Bacillus sp. FJAT-28004]
MGKIFAFYGPSASGKSEIQKELTLSGFQKIITATTRAPRLNEEAGVHYIFMEVPHFKDHIQTNSFIEWTQYNDQYYGTLKSSIEEVLDQDGKTHIVLDLAGVLALKKRYTNIVAVYVGANIESIKRRMASRGGLPDEMIKRVKKAEEVELTSEYMQHADVIIWNHDDIKFKNTMMQVMQIIESGHDA